MRSCVPVLPIIAAEKEWDFAKKHIETIHPSTLKSGYKIKCKDYKGYLLHSFMYFSEGVNKKLVRFARHYLLGKGAFGRVKIVEDEDGNKYALKVLRKKLVPNEELILRKMGYLYFTGANHEPYNQKHYILLKLFDGYNIHDYLQTVGLDESQKLALAYHIVKAVKDVHDIHTATLKNITHEKIIHGDLKFDNIIIYEPQDHQLAVAVIDFGSAKLLKANEEEYVGTSTGCAYYRAPEAKRDIKGIVKLSLKTDIFALGKSLIEELKITKDDNINLMCAEKPEDRPSLESILAALQPYSNILLPKLNRRENAVVKYGYALNFLRKRIQDKLQYTDPKYDDWTLKEWVAEVQRYKLRVTLKDIKNMLLDEVRKVVRYTDNIDELYAFVHTLRYEEFVNPILKKEQRWMWNPGMTEAWIEALNIIKIQAMKLFHELQSAGKVVDHPELYIDILREKRARTFGMKSIRLREFESGMKSQSAFKP